MLSVIEDWVLATNNQFIPNRQQCSTWMTHFSGYFPASFLDQAGFVVVDTLPFPDASLLRSIGVTDLTLLPSPSTGAITYDRTYYVVPALAEQISLHFHELVHVAQYRHLGVNSFIQLYLQQLARHGYRSAPLETMAYDFQEHFECSKAPFDVPSRVALCLDAHKRKLNKTFF